MKRNLIVIVVLLGLVGYGWYDSIKDKQAAAAVTNSGDNGMTIGIQQGNLAPDFELDMLDGTTVKLSDYKGQKVLLNMWATWCLPCRAEMPDMQTFYDDYKDKGVAVLAVNMTKSEKSVEQVPMFLEQYGISFPILLDEHNEVANRYQVRSLPTTYLINSEGIIEQKIIGPMNKEMMKKEVLQLQ